MLSALLAGSAFFICRVFRRLRLRETISFASRCCFAPVWQDLLLAGFSWLLAVGNHVEDHRIAAQGLPLAPGWLRQLAAGCGLGFVLVVIAVVARRTVWDDSHSIALTSHSALRIPVVLFVLIAGSLAEELMFRGYPFQRLVEAIGAGGAILVFSICSVPCTG